MLQEVSKTPHLGTKKCLFIFASGWSWQKKIYNILSIATIATYQHIHNQLTT